MNEEYYIYHRNAFSRFMHCILNAHERLTQQEATHLFSKKTRKIDSTVSEMTARYNSDHERSLVLKGIIRRLTASLQANEERLSIPDFADDKELLSENARLKAFLRRRNDELARLNAAMEAAYENIDARLSDRSSCGNVPRQRGRFHFAAASIF